MIEIRACLLPEPAPLRVVRMPVTFAQTALHPLFRGLAFAAALSSPVLASALADRFHGSVTGAVRAAAVPRDPPRRGTAARPLATPPPVRQAVAPR